MNVINQFLDLVNIASISYTSMLSFNNRPEIPDIAAVSCRVIVVVTLIVTNLSLLDP